MDAGASSKLNVGKPHAAETCHGRDLPGRRRRLTLGNPRCSSNKQTKGINPRASHRHRKRSLKHNTCSLRRRKQLSKVVKETSYLRGSDSPKPTQTSFPEEKRQQRRPLKPGTATRTPASPPSSKQAAGPDRLSGHVGQKGSDLTSRAAKHEGTARGPAPSAASTVPRMAGRPLTSASTAVTSSTKRFQPKSHRTRPAWSADRPGPAGLPQPARHSQGLDPEAGRLCEAAGDPPHSKSLPRTRPLRPKTQEHVFTAG